MEFYFVVGATIMLNNEPIWCSLDTLLLPKICKEEGQSFL